VALIGEAIDAGAEPGAVSSVGVAAEGGDE
jgi:hypothetical protein